MEREKERLKLKKVRTIKLYKEGYIEEEEFQGEMAAVELALRKLDVPEVGGVSYDEVIEAGEHIVGMAALWDVATPEERREMVILLLEPGGLFYDMEQKLIAALKPRPAFLPILRMLCGVVEYDEAKGLLVTERWQDRNRRHRPRSHQCLFTFSHLLENSTSDFKNIGGKGKSLPPRLQFLRMPWNLPLRDQLLSIKLWMFPTDLSIFLVDC